MRWLTEERRKKFEALFAKARPWLPWFSLVLGVAGGVMMDRRPENAWMIATAAVGMWLLLGAFVFMGSLDADQLEGKKAVFAKVVSFSAVMGSQSLIQLCLFFALPFYWGALSFHFGHLFFFDLLLVACALTLWDPLYEFVFRSRLASAALLAFATFAAVNCILPVMGLSNRVSLYGAAIATSALIPALLRLYGLRFENLAYRLAFNAAAVALFPLFIAFGGAAFVPPAPLELADAAMGTQIADRWVADPTDELPDVPEQLVCATAIAAPRGLKDELFHVWWKDGHVVDRVALDVRGGREAGFRTWSIKKRLTKAPRGEWRCAVETASGQTLGRTNLEILESTE